MSAWRVEARRPRGKAGEIRALRAADDVAGYLTDASSFPGGSCEEVLLPANEAEVAQVLGCGRRVLAVGAQSSLTGGATPTGGVVLATSAMDQIQSWSDGSVRLGPGVVLAALEQELRSRDLYYPPVPTYDGAMVGGIVATNAAGAATFKYGTTRAWVAALTIVLPTSDVLDLRRGEVAASAGGHFEIVTSDGRTIRLEVPSYKLPNVVKHSAGYWAAPGMDLIDLFIGAEGTLGVITEVELRLTRPRPAWFAALVPLADERAALALVAALREASQQTWASKDPTGLDVAAIEYLDRRCLELLGEDGAFERCSIPCPTDAGAALIVQAELPASTTRERAFEELSRFGAAPATTPLLRLAAMLADHGVFETAVPVLPGETERRDALFQLREAVPDGVNRRVRERQRTVDPAIAKSGGDVIVPFERLGEALTRYRAILGGHGLDHAIWGHVSDGNVHPNVLARSAEEMKRAGRAQLEIGECAIELGGSPMSEHGVGRSSVKQALLRRLYGEEGMRAMRRVKEALDPNGVLAPGVIFAAGGTQ